MPKTVFEDPHESDVRWAAMVETEGLIYALDIVLMRLAVTSRGDLDSDIGRKYVETTAALVKAIRYAA